MTCMLAYRALSQLAAGLIVLALVCGALFVSEAGGTAGIVASALACWICLTLAIWISWRLRVIRWHTARMIESALQDAARREQEQDKKKEGGSHE